MAGTESKLASALSIRSTCTGQPDDGEVQPRYMPLTMAPEHLPPPERAGFETAETIVREPAPHDACDRLCEVIILRSQACSGCAARGGEVPNADCVPTLVCRLTLGTRLVAFAAIATAHRRQASQRLMSKTGSCPSWLPKPQSRAGRINDDAELTRAHYLDFLLHHLGSKRLGLACRGLKVIDLHVGQPRGWRTRNWLFHQSAPRPFANPDHSVGAVTYWNVFELPIEELPVKGLGFGNVRGAEFNVHKWIS